MAALAFNLEVDDFKDFLEELRDLNQVVEAGLVASGPAAAYAEVWEWGNARQTQQGPKTVLGVNPDGETVWLSTQAPMGYIGIHSDKYLEIVESELSSLSIGNGNSAEDELKKVAHKVLEKIKEVVQEHAPVDSGQLRDCFQVVDDGDPALEGEGEGSIESKFKRVLTIS